MPYRDGNPTLGEQIEEDERRAFYTDDLLKEAQELQRENKRLCEALRDYAAVQPLDLKSPSQIQRDLRAIAGEEHIHLASIGSDRCLLCRHDLRHEIHTREPS